MDDAIYRAALAVFHRELGLPLIEAGRLASAVVVWSAETPKARAAALEEHGAALRSTGAGRAEAEAMRERCAAWHEAQADEYDREARERTLPNGEWAGRDAMWARADAQDHRRHAVAIRALPAQTTGGAGE